MSTKFKSAEAYDSVLADDCETVLVVLLQAFGSLKATIRLVGGLVPRYLTPTQPPDVPPHVGTTDVDVVLNVALLAEKGTYDKLRQQLKASGFRPYQTAEGKISSWQWVYELDGRQVLVEFLQNTNDPGQSGRLGTVDHEGISAVQFLHAGVVHEWFEERKITIALPDGDGVVTEVIRFADIAAFIVLKTIAFNTRHERKDAADLIHVMRYWKTLDDLVALFVQRLQSGLHREVLIDVLCMLENHFCDDDAVQGWQKDGPSKFANFHQVGEPGSDAFVREQRDVSAMVTYFVAQVRKRLA